MNAWYATSWSADLQHQLQGLVICDLPIVQYRRSDGVPVILEDACWHRLLPLSMGKLSGDRVECAYHGLQFDSGGKCHLLPDGSKAPPNACVKAYPVVERHGLVWVWPGDPQLADPAKVPDLHWANDPSWASEGTMLEFACDYRLIVDNLLDLTHEAYVHAESIGHQALVSAPFTVTKTDEHVRVERWMSEIDAPPFLREQLCAAHNLETSPKVDRWQLIRFEPPSTIVIDVGVAPVGTGAKEGNRTRGVSGRVLNAITPSTAYRSYYFFAYARDFLIDDPELTATLKASNIRIFTEDKDVLERQQQSINRFSSRHLVDLKIDRGSLYARRMIKAMQQAEDRSRPGILATP